MTLDEAIKFLQNYPIGASPDNDIKFQKAIQLGIEALKVVKEFRTGRYKTINSPLPGETK